MTPQAGSRTLNQYAHHQINHAQTQHTVIIILQTNGLNDNNGVAIATGKNNLDPE